MASSESQNDRFACLKKIDAGLDLWKNCSVTESSSLPMPRSFKSMLMEYSREIALNIKDVGENTFFCIPSSHLNFPGGGWILGSKILEDDELYDAVYFSKIFDSAEHFEQHGRNYLGQLVWVYSHTVGVLAHLISKEHDRIIYSVERDELTQFREDLANIWTHLRRKVENNLREAFGITEIDRDQSESISKPESSEKAATSQIESSELVSSEKAATGQIEFISKPETSEKAATSQIESSELVSSEKAATGQIEFISEPESSEKAATSQIESSELVSSEKAATGQIEFISESVSFEKAA